MPDEEWPVSQCDTHVLSLPTRRTVGEVFAAQRTMPRVTAAVWLITSTLCGVVFRLAIANGMATIVATFMFWAAATALVTMGRVRRRSAVVLIAAGALFAAFLTVRTSPWLVWVNGPTAAALILAGGSYARTGSPWQPVNVILRRLASAARALLAGPRAAIEAIASVLPAPRSTNRSRFIGATALRGAVLGGPLLIAVTLLLARADGVPRTCTCRFHQPASWGMSY